MITVNKSVQISVQKASRQAEVDALRDAKGNAGFLYQGNLFQIDIAAQTNMTAVFSMLKAGITNPHGGYWRSQDNTMVPMDDNAVGIFIIAAKNYILQLLSVGWTHKDNISALTSIAAVDSYNINTNWP